METNFVLPGFTEMMSQINTFQKENVDRMMAAMNEGLGGKNPMNIFSSEKMADYSMTGGFSDFFDIMQKTTRGMLDISRILMPALSGDGKNPMGMFMENLPEIPAQIIKKLLEIPPVGITRPYQEKINQALDKLGMYNTAAMEFLYCTCIPLEEATRMTLTEIMKKSDSVKSMDDAQKIYEKWLKILEEEYQALFKTDRYKHVLAKIMNAMGEYRAASRELILDIMHLAGLPFGREVDELCKDVFTLKKKIKELEATLKRMEKSTVH
ncbi:MAG: hypothetical protein KKD44_17715 [Proteobacteria bacterium]|nr:hypothetical protein [Pseudomonadota bacterium]